MLIDIFRIFIKNITICLTKTTNSAIMLEEIKQKYRINNFCLKILYKKEVDMQDIKKDCKFFRQHYNCSKHGHISNLDCGHCVFPRTKLRKAYDICGYFQNKKTALQATEEPFNEK